MTALALTEMVDRVFADRYRVESLIGAGPISAVYVASDLIEDRLVALKVFDADLADDERFAARLFDVVERAASLNHQNIVDVYDWGIDGGPYIVSELCEGGSLASILADGDLIDGSQALVVALESARALNHGHEQGVIHRGLNPRNVLFGAEGRVRLSDFGLAAVLAEVSVSQSNRALENVRYSSPEQARGRPVTEATDLYSLALIVNEAVTGSPPVVAETVVGTLMARAESPVQPDPALQGLAPAMERCGKVDASLRPEADELTIALLAAAETMPRPGPPPLERLDTALVADPDLEVAGGSAATIDASNAREPGVVVTSEVDVVTVLASTPDPEVDDDLAGFDISALGQLDDFEGFGSDDLGQLDDLAGFGGDDLGQLDDLEGFGGDDVEAPGLSALDNLEDVEPVFATPGATADPSDQFDVPARSPGRTSRTTYEEIDDDADDRLPWWPLAVLMVLVVGGIAASLFFLGVGQSTSAGTAPAVTGLTLEELAGVVDADTQIEVLERRENGSAAGTIVEQIPAAGQDIDNDAPLIVTVSLGEEMVELPSDIVGLTLEQAASRLTLVGLTVGELTEENNEALAAGLVIGLNEPTTQKPAGQSVALRISLGPDDRVVPNEIIGSAIGDATSLLAGLRLQAIEEPAYSPDAEAGTVLAAIPPPGEIVEADSAVTLIVSAGPEPVEMPDIAGLALGEAREIIEELGLISVDFEGTPGEEVIGSLPPIGAIVDVGTEVLIILGEGDEDDEDDG